MSNKDNYIKLFRDEKFNCFPLIRYREGETNTKRADARWQGRRTPLDQLIKDSENYGMSGTVDGRNGILDLDDKERYRKFAERLVSEGKMVIETGGGWHIPVKGFSTTTSKIELFNYAVQDKKIIEFQGPDHYVIGCGSIIWHDRLEREVIYENIGSDEIWDVRGKDFNAWIDVLCRELEVESKTKRSNSSYKNLRDKFKEGKIPTDGQSNDYYHQAALVCLTEGLTVSEAEDKIKKIYDEWKDSKYYSNRPWSSIRSKIEYTYENDTPIHEGRPSGGGGKIDRTVIVNGLIGIREFYSNLETGNIYENRDGFLEKVNLQMGRELIKLYPELEKADYDSILFKLGNQAEEMPETNDDYFVFKNGVRSLSTKESVETDEIGSMGFKEYNYLPTSKENEPVEFLKVIFGDVNKHEHPRIKAGLKAVLQSSVDSRMSVVYGASGVGKSTGLTILDIVLTEEYSLIVELDQFLNDHFIRAKIDGKRLLIFQDLPEVYKDFATIKTITGESRKTERGFHQDMVSFDNKLKIWASGNYLAKIPENEKDAMYTRRLSLIHNIRTEAHEEDSTFAKRIAKEEGEKIISWIFNIPDEECKYEGKITVKKEWEGLASPEVEYLEENYEFDDGASDMGVIRLVKDFKEKYQQPMSTEIMTVALNEQGYSARNNIVKNCKLQYKKPKQPDTPQKKIGFDKS